MKNFEVLSLQWNGPEIDWNWASTVKAHDYKTAVKEWAETVDPDNEYEILDAREHGPVLVREVGEEAYKKFNIFAEVKPYYSASEEIYD